MKDLRVSEGLKGSITKEQRASEIVERDGVKEVGRRQSLPITPNILHSKGTPISSSVLFYFLLQTILNYLHLVS